MTKPTAIRAIDSCRRPITARRRGAVFCALLLAAALVGSCGSDPDSVETVQGPLPVGGDDAQAYSERFLAVNPRADLQPEHLAIVQLEPTEGDRHDTCADQEGVDCLPYFIAVETALTLGIDDSAPEVARLALRNAAGATVVSVEAGEQPVTAVVAPGEYVLQLTHTFAGDADADTPTIFLGPDVAEAEAAAETTEPALAPATSAPPRSTSLTARGDCVRCNLARSDLTDQSFDGANLTSANFNEAKFLRTTLRNATLIGATMTNLYPRTGDVYADGGNLTDHFDADFSGAKAPGVTFTFFIEHVFNQEQALPFFAIFRGATLDDTLWESEPTGPPSALRPDFSNASMKRAHFSFMVLTTPTKCAATSRARPDACSFRGADLTGAVFDDYFWNMNNTVVREFHTVGNNLAHCSFGVEPTSGRRTIMQQVQMLPTESRRADVSSADLSGADLTGAVLTSVELDDRGGQGCARQPSTLAGADLSGATLTNVKLTGANLSGAKFPGTRVPGVTWRGVNLTDATLTGLVPPTFNDIDVTGANFSGVDFNGFDLTRSDFSKATLSSPPRLTGAKLSDGTRGVTLGAVKFPPRYELFKGLDLTGVNLQGSELFEANLEGTILNHATLIGANLNFATLRKAKLRGAMLGVQPGSEASAASLRGAFMPDIDLSDADLRSVDLTGAHLYGDQTQTLLVRTRLDSAVFVNAICSGANFSGSLNNAAFVGAQLVNTVFNGATLTGVKFDDAYLQGADFSNALSATGASLSNAAVSAMAGTWNFQEIDGTPFTIRYEATKLGLLATDTSVRCPDGRFGPCCASGSLATCLNEKLKPVRNGPFPPVPDCVPRGPRYDNCSTPLPTRTPARTPTPTPRRS
jgi:uncharacterized protein YjbI with pentapeptide repeats